MTAIILSDICLLDTGHVMYLDAKQIPGFSEATLEHSFDKLTALGCQIRY